jgi:hypothetical protein
LFKRSIVIEHLIDRAIFARRLPLVIGAIADLGLLFAGEAGKFCPRAAIIIYSGLMTVN